MFASTRRQRSKSARGDPFAAMMTRSGSSSNDSDSSNSQEPRLPHRASRTQRRRMNSIQREDPFFTTDVTDITNTGTTTPTATGNSSNTNVGSGSLEEITEGVPVDDVVVVVNAPADTTSTGRDDAPLTPPHRPRHPMVTTPTIPTSSRQRRRVLSARGDPFATATTGAAASLGDVSPTISTTTVLGGGDKPGLDSRGMMMMIPNNNHIHDSMATTTAVPQRVTKQQQREIAALQLQVLRLEQKYIKTQKLKLPIASELFGALQVTKERLNVAVAAATGGSNNNNNIHTNNNTNVSVVALQPAVAAAAADYDRNGM